MDAAAACAFAHRRPQLIRGVGPTRGGRGECIALGQVFANQTALRWVTVLDEYGRDPALQYPGTTALVFPLTMISKRIEEGRDVSLRPLFAAVRDQVERMKDDPEYRR